MTIHILPINDIFPHKEEGTDCICMPKIITSEYDVETGVETIFDEVIVSHNAWDKRE